MIVGNVPDKRNVPAIRFVEYTEDYARTTLGKIGNTYNGLTGKSAEDFGQGFPYITYKSIFDNSRVDISRVEYVQISDIEQHNKKQNKVARGDIFFTTSSETPEEVGMTSVLLDNIEDCYLNSFCFGYRVYSQEQYLPEYLRFYLRSSIIRKKLFVLAQGSTRFNLSKNEVMRISINMPKALEQRKIARFLTLLEERITTQNKIIERLETLIKGIVDFIFTANKFPKVPFKEIYIHAGEGGTPATSIPEYYDNGTIPFIKIDDLQNKYIESNKDYITELGLQKSSAWIVPSNSIIYSNGATIGAISINLFPVCTKQGILGIVPKANINVKFLYYFMTSTVFTKAVERIVTEGTMRTAYLKDINHILCPIPCSARQNEIAKLLSNLSAKLENEMAFQKKLREQKDFLLSQMFI